MYESHTSDHLSGILKEAVIDWKISRSNVHVHVTTDNARNIANAVEAARFSLHIRCFAHTVNLAALRGMGVHQMSRLLGRVRKVVTFFHRSITAAVVYDIVIPDLQFTRATAVSYQTHQPSTHYLPMLTWNQTLFPLSAE